MPRLITLLLAACATLVGCSDTVKGKSIAEPEVEIFHQRLNEKQFEHIFAAASGEFQKTVSKEKVFALFSAIDRKLGLVKSSSTKTWNVRSVNFVTTVVLVVDTVFEQGNATETFTFQVSDNKAELVGYNINSLDMLIK